MPTPQPTPTIPTASWPVTTIDRKCDPVWYKYFHYLLITSQGAQVVGSVFAFAGNIVPPGTLQCNGQAVSRAQYAALFTVLGTTWGAGDGSSTFNVPNIPAFLQGPAGGPVGTIGGSNATILTAANMPEQSAVIVDPGHTHIFTGTPHTHTITDPGHDHTITDPGHAHPAQAIASNATAGAAVGSAVGSTGSAPTGITVNDNTTGITINPATAGGTNSVAVTGVSATTGSATPTAIPTVPSYSAIQWLIYTGPIQ